MNIVSFFLDLVAPKASAELNVELTENYAEFIESLTNEHKLLSKSEKMAKFRIDGDFFSDLKATQVVVGRQAEPKHYSNVGFYLEVYLQNSNIVLLKAEERVILGYIETKAVGLALLSMLKKLVLLNNECNT